MDLNAKEIGKRIKKYRKEKRLTQKELAKLIGCAEMTISQYERGLYLPKTDTRIALANALGISYGDLFIPDQTPLVFDSPEEFMKARDEALKKARASNKPTIEITHQGDGTVTNVARYRFEAKDLSEREYQVFDNLYSLLRNKDDNTPK